MSKLIYTYLSFSRNSLFLIKRRFSPFSFVNLERKKHYYIAEIYSNTHIFQESEEANRKVLYSLHLMKKLFILKHLYSFPNKTQKSIHTRTYVDIDCGAIVLCHFGVSFRGFWNSFRLEWFYLRFSVWRFEFLTNRWDKFA